MDRQKMKHCGRCHNAIVSNTIEFSEKEPIVYYKTPARCNVCKSTNYRDTDIVDVYLPTEEDGIKCKCKFPGCEEEFWSRDTWYTRQQEIAKSTGNPWMPTLIDDRYLNKQSVSTHKKDKD